MKNNDVDRDRVQRANDRRNEAIAQQIERQEEHKPEEPPEAGRDVDRHLGARAADADVDIDLGPDFWEDEEASNLGNTNDHPDDGDGGMDIDWVKRVSKKEEKREHISPLVTFNRPDNLFADEEFDLPKQLVRGGEGGVKEENVHIVELFSPPRVAVEADKFGLKTGLSIDLLTGWDLTDKKQQKQVMEYIERVKPMVVVGSPPCTMFSQLQNLTEWNANKQKKYEEATDLMNFAAKVYETQMKAGRYFVHENPIGASSWTLPSIQRLKHKKGVEEKIADLCMYGLKTTGKNKSEQVAARKRTKFIGNATEVMNLLGQKCNGQHRHQELVNGRAQKAGVYPSGLCRAICRGTALQMREDKAGRRCLLSVTAKDKIYEIPEEEEIGELEAAWDDTSGKALDPRGVRRARLKDMGYINEKGVWTIVDRQWALAKGIKIVGTKWLDVDKGDASAPNLRSRLVAKEFNDGTDGGQASLFAATPPLEALRLLISEAATVEEKDDVEGKTVLLADISRAFFEAPAVRQVCVELPGEAFENGQVSPGKVGLLNLSLYGTRDAAANFQREVKNFMEKNGWKVSEYNPCVFWHSRKRMAALVHGDDFVVVGNREDAKWFKDVLEQRFEVKTTMVGRRREAAGRDLGWGGKQGKMDWAKDTEDEQVENEIVQEARILNRIIRVTEDGWQLEADQRHADIAVEALGLKEAKATTSPGTDEKTEYPELDEPLKPRDASEF